MQQLWYNEEVALLRRLQVSCRDLAEEYLNKYKKLQSMYYKFRIPSIMLSSVSGILIFGDQKFASGSGVEKEKRILNWTSVAVGLANFGVAVLNTIETFLKIGERMERSLQAHITLKKLSEDIFAELQMPEATRKENGSVYVRETLSRYHDALEKAPTLSELLVISDSTQTEPERLGFVNRIQQSMVNIISPFRRSFRRQPRVTATVTPVHEDEAYV